MPVGRIRAGGVAAELDAAAATNANTEKYADATDEEQSSDDEAPEEVSAEAATALAGSRRNAELAARKAAPEKKRPRTSTKAKKAGRADDLTGGTEGSSGSGLELPSDLLLKVKSGGLQRREAEAEEQDDQFAVAEAGVALANHAGRSTKAGDETRSDNFRLVVLGGDEDGVDSGARSKPHASEMARDFLRKHVQGQKRVSHGLFRARTRLGPSPNF